MHRWRIALLLLTTGCAPREMGQTCERTEQCVAEGACLKGVCSGYGCQQDTDCAEDMRCGDVGGVSVCVTPCAEDADCAGEQACDLDGGHCL